MKSLVPAYVPSPGEILLDELEARELSQQAFAEIIGKPAQAISEIINNKKSITPATARQFEAALGVSARFWLNLQTEYDLFRSREEYKDQEADIRTKARLYELVPLNELKKRGWIPNTKDLKILVHAVLEFLGLKSLDEEPRVAVSFRTGNTHHQKDFKASSSAQLAWLKRVEHLAHQKQAASYDPAVLDQLLPSILSLSTSLEKLTQLPGLLASAGIILVLEDHLPSSYVNGAALWLEGRPVVALSYRYPQLDRFWFNLLHEIGHIRLGHDGIMLDDFEHPSEEHLALEEEANRFASNWIVPEDEWQQFLEEGPHTTHSIEVFAEKVQRHRCMIAGRLQRHHADYRRHRECMVNIRAHLSLLQ